MLITLVGLYLFVSICIGLYASTKVKNSSDYVVAGRHLPLPFIVATVFATWFGSETVLGIPSKFLNEGMRGVVADPFDVFSAEQKMRTKADIARIFHHIG